MHFTCTFDLKVPEKRRQALYELLSLANEKLWIGHFGMDSDDGMPVFRHAVLLRGAPGASAESLEDMVDIAITECERFYPAFSVRALGREVAGGGVAGGDAGVRRRGMNGDRLPPLLLIGGGKMGGALLAGWLELGLAESIVVDPAEAAQGLAGGQVSVVPSLAAVPKGFEPACVVLAVKPQQADAVLPGVKRFGETVTVSIMAGRTVAGAARGVGRGAGGSRYAKHTGGDPARDHGRVCGTWCPAEHRALADRLLSSVGEVAWVEDEALIDPVTAISGGGRHTCSCWPNCLRRQGWSKGCGRSGAAVGAGDGFGVGGVVGREPAGCGGAAGGGDQSAGDDGTGSRSLDGR